MASFEAARLAVAFITKKAASAMVEVRQGRKHCQARAGALEPRWKIVDPTLADRAAGAEVVLDPTSSLGVDLAARKTLQLVPVRMLAQDALPSTDSNYFSARGDGRSAPSRSTAL